MENPDWIVARVDAASEVMGAGPFGLCVFGRNLSDEGRDFTWWIDARYVLRNPRYTFAADCIVTDAAQARIDGAGEWLLAHGGGA